MAAVLVVYYSHSGHTKAAAESIAARLNADIRRILAPARSPRGLVGFLRAGMDSWRGRAWPTETPYADVAAYDLVVLCSPVWAGRLAPPARAWLQAARGQIRALAACATVGGTKGARFFADIEALMPLPLRARAIVTDAERKSREDGEILRRFAHEVEASR